MRIEELREKEVINTCTCHKLGYVGDVEFDLCSGQVCALIIYQEGHCCGLFGHEREYRVCFCDITQIGNDIILVTIKEEDCIRRCKKKCLSWMDRL